MFPTKLTEKIPNPRNAKEHYQSFLRKENLKTSHKLSKTENIFLAGTNNSLHSKTKKSEHFLNEKHAKIPKQAYAFKGYASSYNVEILNSFKPDSFNLQLKIN